MSDLEKLTKPNRQIDNKLALPAFFVLVVVLLVLDRLTKNLAIAQLASGNSIEFIPGIMDFVLVLNRGGAFGLFDGAATVFVVFAVLVVVAIIVYLLKLKRHNPVLVLALSLAAAGAMGNAFDRLVSGTVPDFLHTLFIEFPVFNVADCCLTIGVAILLIMIIASMFRPEPSEQAQAQDQDPDQAQDQE